jgi:hypothetical protein
MQHLKNIMVTAIFFALSTIYFGCKKKETCTKTCENNLKCIGNNICNCPEGTFILNGICMPIKMKNSKYLYVPANPICSNLDFKYLFFNNGFLPDTNNGNNQYLVHYEYYNTGFNANYKSDFYTFSNVEPDVIFTGDFLGFKDNNTVNSCILKAKTNLNNDTLKLKIYCSTIDAKTNAVLSSDSCDGVYYRLYP